MSGLGQGKETAEIKSCDGKELLREAQGNLFSHHSSIYGDGTTPKLLSSALKIKKSPEKQILRGFYVWKGSGLTSAQP